MQLQWITSYMLTGGRGRDYGMTGLQRSGVINDRHLVVYDPETMERLSSKARQLPEITRLYAHPDITQDTATGFLIEDSTDNDRIVHTQPARDESEYESITVIEFKKDQVDCLDMGDAAAGNLTDFFGRSVRLARKSREWLCNDRVGREDQVNAPYHIISSATIQSVADARGLEYDEVRRRFRPNLVVDNPDGQPHDEHTWAHVQIGGVTLSSTGGTVRCEVPEQDSRTGERTEHLDKYRFELPKTETRNGTKRALGIYAYVERIDTISFVQVGDTVEVGVKVG